MGVVTYGRQEEDNLTEWAKFAGFLVGGLIIHASAYFATQVLPLKKLDEPEKAGGGDAEIVPLRAPKEEEIVEVEALDPKPDEAGIRQKGEEGSMGNPSTSDSASKRYAVKGPQDNADPHLARQAALRDAQEFGMIGLLNAGAGGDPNAPTAPWGRDDALGSDAKSARGNMWGDEIGDAFGAGGLGLTGIGEGGGGRGEGIGLGNIGTLGHGAGTGTGQGFGSGHGYMGGHHSRTKPAQVRMGAVSVSGRLPPEVIQRIVRQNFGRFRLCYENGLRSDPNLSGTVSTSFTIGRDGGVSEVSGSGTIKDAGVVGCVTKAFYGLSFPQPEGGAVKVTYPIAFSPGDGPAPGGSSSLSSSSGSDTTTKALSEMSGSDFKKALVNAGCTDVSGGSGGVSVFSAKRNGTTFTITFASASAGGADALGKTELARLLENASVRRSGGAFLAVESADKDAARSLLSALPR